MKTFTRSFSASRDFTPFVFRYLQEVGYTDTILDVRTQRVRSLLGLSGSEQNGAVENKNLQHLINGTERCKDGKR